MSEAEASALRCDLSWDKFAPGYLRYKLGEVELISTGVIYRKSMRTHIPQGQGLIIMRNLMLYYPGFITYEAIYDRLWSNPDEEPSYANEIIRGVIRILRQRIQKVGMNIVLKNKYGYRLEFIPGWESL